MKKWKKEAFSSQGVGGTDQTRRKDATRGCSKLKVYWKPSFVSLGKANTFKLVEWKLEVTNKISHRNWVV